MPPPSILIPPSFSHAPSPPHIWSPRPFHMHPPHHTHLIPPSFSHVPSPPHTFDPPVLYTCTLPTTHIFASFFHSHHPLTCTLPTVNICPPFSFPLLSSFLHALSPLHTFVLSLLPHLSHTVSTATIPLSSSLSFILLALHAHKTIPTIMFPPHKSCRVVLLNLFWLVSRSGQVMHVSCCFSRFWVSYQQTNWSTSLWKWRRTLS